MTNRVYRFLFGAVLVLALYFDQPAVVHGLIAMGLAEGLTGWTVPRLIGRLRGRQPDPDEGSLGIRFRRSIPFDAERAWRLTVSAALLISYDVFPDALWFFPWFMGFAIVGAGASGVCPMFLTLRWVGFR